MVELPRCSQCSGFFIRCANHNITSLHQEKIFKDLEKENERLEKVVRGLEQGDYQRSLINENQTLKSRVGLREMEIGELKSQIRALENQLTEQESNNFSQEDRKTIAQLFGITSFTSLSFIGRVEEEKGKLDKEIQGLRNCNKQLNKENQDKATKISELTQQVRFELPSRIQHLQSEISKKDGDLRNTQKEVRELEVKLKNEQDRLKKVEIELKNQLQTLQEQLKEKESEISAKQTEIEDSAEQYEKFMELEDKVEELEQKLTQIKKKLGEWVRLVGGRGVKVEKKKGWFW